MSLAGENARTSAALSEPNLEAVPYPGLRGYVQSGDAGSVTVMDAAFVAENTGVLDHVGTYPYTAAPAVANLFVGAYIRVFASNGAAQERAILSSTAAGVVNVTPDWDTAPDNTYTYVIHGIVTRITKPLSYALTVGEYFPTVANADTAEPTHPLSGGLMRILTGAAKNQVVEITSFLSSGPTATVTPQLKVIPDVGDTCAIYGEQSWASAATASGMTMGTMLTTVDGHYDGLYVEIRQCATRTAAVGQVRKILTQVGTALTLASPWDHVPQGDFAYAIFGGWGCEYVSVGEAASALTQISVASGVVGVRETWNSLTPTSYNKNGVLVAERQIKDLYGSDATDRTYAGKALTSDYMFSKFYRFNLIAFNFLEGGVRTRLCKVFSTASAAAKKEFTEIEQLDKTPSSYETVVATGGHPTDKAVHLTATCVQPQAGLLVTSNASGGDSGIHLMTLVPSTGTFQVRGGEVDTAGGIGAVTVELEGVNESSLAQAETIALNGATDVATALQDWRGINSCTVTSVGAGTTNQGLIQVWNATDEYYCTVAPAEGQARRLVYYTTAQTKALVRRVNFTLTPGVSGGIQTVKVGLYKYDYNSGVRKTILTVSLDTTAALKHEEAFTHPLLVESSSVFWAEVTEAAGGGSPVLTAHVELTETVA